METKRWGEWALVTIICCMPAMVFGERTTAAEEMAAVLGETAILRETMSNGSPCVTLFENGSPIKVEAGVRLTDLVLLRNRQRLSPRTDIPGIDWQVQGGWIGLKDSPAVDQLPRDSWQRLPLYPGFHLHAGQAAPVQVRQDEQGLVDQVSQTELMARVNELVAFQTRYSTTTGFANATTYVQSKLVGYGLSTELQPFTVSSTTVNNVIATLPGITHPEIQIIIGGHYDSTSENRLVLAPGADDNGSGAAGVLEAARIMANQQFECTIKFICFAAEEQGMVGSYHYVSVAQSHGDDIQDAIIMDMIAYGPMPGGYVLWLETSSVGVPLMDELEANAYTYTTLGITRSLNPFGSDHMPFLDVNIPAVLTIENAWDSNPNYHRTTDTPGYLNAPFFADIVRVNVATAAELAGWVSPTPTATPSGSPSPSTTPTITPTFTSGPSFSPTRSPTVTISPTRSPTATGTRTPTPTRSPTRTSSPTTPPTLSPTATNSATLTPTRSPTSTSSPTNSPTLSPTSSSTPAPTSTPTRSPTITMTPSASPTLSPTAANSPTATFTGTLTPTSSPTVSATYSPTLSMTPTLSPTPTSSPTATPSLSPTLANSPTRSPTASATLTPSPSPTLTPSQTATASPTATPTSSPTITPSPTIKPSATATITIIPTTSTLSPTATATPFPAIPATEPSGLLLLLLLATVTIGRFTRVAAVHE